MTFQKLINNLSILFVRFAQRRYNEAVAKYGAFNSLCEIPGEWTFTVSARTQAFNSLCEIPAATVTMARSTAQRLSILFVRFLAIIVFEGDLVNCSFNSLCEILRRGGMLGGRHVLPRFQFSL